VVEQFSVGGEGAEGCGGGVGEDIFDDDEGVGPEECVEEVWWDGGIGAEGEPGEEQEGGVHDESAGAEEDPLSANECARHRRAEAGDGNAVEDPGDLQCFEMEERFAGADEDADRLKMKEAREEGVANFVRDGERVLKEEDQEDDRDVRELEGTAFVAGAEADEQNEEGGDSEDDVNAFVEAAVAIWTIGFGAAEGEAFLGEGLAAECCYAADVAVCGDGSSISAGVMEKRKSAEAEKVSHKAGCSCLELRTGLELPNRAKREARFTAEDAEERRERRGGKRRR
jgi:hypothetical protein